MKKNKKSVIEYLLPLALIGDVMFLIFYYTRMSTINQEFNPGAYDVVVGSLENHHLAGLLFAFVAGMTPLFFFAQRLKIESFQLNAIHFDNKIISTILILANVMVFCSEIGMTAILYQVKGNSIISSGTDNSTFGTIVGWFVAILFALFHQASAALTVLGLDVTLSRKNQDNRG